MAYYKELYLTNKNILRETWEKLVSVISKLNGNYLSWQLIIKFEDNMSHPITIMAYEIKKIK